MQAEWVSGSKCQITWNLRKGPYIDKCALFRKIYEAPTEIEDRWRETERDRGRERERGYADKGYSPS